MNSLQWIDQNSGKLALEKIITLKGAKITTVYQLFVNGRSTINWGAGNGLIYKNK